MSGAIYPTVNEGRALRRANSGGVLIEPADPTLSTGEYSEPVGFAGTPIDLQIECKGAMSPAENVTIELSDDEAFTAPTAHSASPVDVSSLASGAIVRVGLQPEARYFRVVNGGTAAIQLTIWRIPNR